MTDLQRAVQDAIDAQVADGRETGVQVAVYRGGELVVDAVAGLADPETGRPVRAGTPFYAWSMGKAITSTIVHRLVERGLFGYDTTIASLWPEFGIKGKDAVTVRHVLHHTAGVPGIGTETTAADLCDWDLICGRIADSELWWEPGTQTGYHSYTFGYLLGEVCRRATGTPIGELVHTEVAEPIGMRGELWFSVPPAEQHRLARLVDDPATDSDQPPALPPDSPIARSAAFEVWPSAALGNRPDVLAADIPATGKMTARAVSRMYAALVGEVGGVRLLRPETMRTVLADRFEGTDQIFGNEAAWCLGFALGRLGGSPADGTFGFGGGGGSFGYADPAAGLAMAYVKNRQTDDFADAEEIVRLVANG
ncbi:serine hydrolase domain-containing protein [Paractinoplanes rishiriensis]|uniref:Esterase n=1 Tax=Paractinoplanes rishiriensis TaxID=1050105 RepID=A0A919N2Q5_9ACTN|nr:serine hydrolase domain-containing protein [Actinoplanes rishiriensis]GIF01363.1 esterase [Actinoplanes rishiriensis]